MEIRDRKAAQRRAGIMARRGLPQAERAAANAAICARLLAMPCFQKAENLLLYAAFGGEVDLAGLAEQAARLGKTVAYPVCGENFTLTAICPGAGTPWRWAWPLRPSGCRKRLQMNRTGSWMDL